MSRSDGSSSIPGCSACARERRRFKGWSCSEWMDDRSSSDFTFCPISSSFDHACWSRLSEPLTPLPPQQATNLCTLNWGGLRHSTFVASKRHNSDSERSSEDSRQHALPVSLDTTLIKDSSPLTPSRFYLFFVYVWSILCVCLTSVWNSKDETTKKMTKHYGEGKQCWWNSDHII